MLNVDIHTGNILFVREFIDSGSARHRSRCAAWSRRLVPSTEKIICNVTIHSWSLSRPVSLLHARRWWFVHSRKRSGAILAFHQFNRTSSADWAGTCVMLIGQVLPLTCCCWTTVLTNKTLWKKRVTVFEAYIDYLSKDDFKMEMSNKFVILRVALLLNLSFSRNHHKPSSAGLFWLISMILPCYYCYRRLSREKACILYASFCCAKMHGKANYQGQRLTFANFAKFTRHWFLIGVIVDSLQSDVSLQ